MTTYREAIYMCLDLLKGMSDDFTYTEDHVAYLLDKFRALLLKQRYGNDPKKHVPYSNYQTIEVKMTNQDDGIYLGDIKIPYTLQLGIPRVTIDNYYDIKYQFISRERFPFVGNNKFLKNFVYLAVDEDNDLRLKTNCNCCCMEDEITIKLTAIFENPREVVDETSFGESSTAVHPLDRNIPIEESLIINLIELVVKELAGSMYIPVDNINNNKDDKASMAGFIQANMKSELAKQMNR